MGRPKQQHGRVTIQAVAERAGVSPMTVSNVSNGTGKVGAATRLRVLAAIEALGYVPNVAARRLMGSAIARIGLIHYDVESMFINAMMAGIATAAAEKGLQLLIRTSCQVSRSDTVELARSLVRSGAQALLLIPPFAELLAAAWPDAGIDVPAVALATAEPLPGLTTVRIDNFAAAHAMTARLAGGGRRRIAVVTGPLNHSDSVARLAGHRAALQEYGLPFDEALCIEGHFTFASGLAAGERLLGLADPPDAVVAANDDMAAGLLWVAHRNGVSVPERLAITGFDDTLLATRVWPSLTTVRQPIGDMAAHALDLAIEAARDPDGFGPPRDRLLPFTVIERGSS
jgi:LacI family transcriptional regulator